MAYTAIKNNPTSLMQNITTSRIDDSVLIASVVGSVVGWRDQLLLLTTAYSRCKRDWYHVHIREFVSELDYSTLHSSSHHVAKQYIL